MAITFQEKLKKQKNMIVVFVVLVLLTAIIIWRGYYVQREPEEKVITRRFAKIDIDFEVLESPLMKEFNLMERIPLFEGQVGRENPFVPIQ